MRSGRPIRRRNASGRGPRAVSHRPETETALAFLHCRIFGRKTGFHPCLRRGRHFPENALDMRVDHADKRLELIDIDGNGSLKALTRDGGTELHAMHQVELL
jgi:hypothetical protein